MTIGKKLKGNIDSWNQVNTTNDIHYTNTYMELHLLQVFGNHGWYGLPEQMPARFVTFKLMHYSNPSRALPESGVP